MTAERVNFRAAGLGLWDVKSAALKTLLEEVGLASPNRWVFCLRNRFVPPPGPFPVVYTVIRRNFDPITAAESLYINGRLWTYVDIVQFDPAAARSISVNSTVDPLDFGRFDPVAAAFDNAGFGPGSFFTGLTRDDVGGIKFIYQSANRNTEAAIPGSTGSASGGSPWSIPGGTNAPALIDPTLRYGVDKLNFIRVDYDSIIGQFFIPITNSFSETVVSNGVSFRQVVQRVLVQPDFLFTAADLNGPDSPPGIPASPYARTVTAGWQNSDNIGVTTFRHAGPGVILPPVNLVYNNVGFIHVDVMTGSAGNAVLGSDVLPWYLWGAFDGTTNEPVVFSQGGNITLQQLEQIRLGR
jgi:hypothetical protein